MADVSKRDYLSHLPFELLAEIFEHAYKDHAPPKSPISRALLPLQQQALLRRVHIRSLSGLDRFLEAYETNKSLGKAIRVLRIDGDHLERNRRATTLKRSRRFAPFYSSLCNLEELELGIDANWFLNDIIARCESRCELPPLRRISFHAPEDWENALDPEWYQGLRIYPFLRCLEVITPPCHKPTANNDRVEAEFTNINEVVLKGKRVDHPSTRAFLDSFPNLTCLALDTLCTAPVYSPIASLLPTTLTSLALHNSAWASDWYQHPCDEHLPRFVNLQHLYLGARTYGNNLLKSLRRLPHLRSLGFGPGAFLHWRRLDKILLGPSRLPKLERIILDQLAGEAKGRSSPDCLTPEWHDSSGFGYFEVSTLVELAKAEGISVEGNVVEAIAIQDRIGGLSSEEE